MSLILHIDTALVSATVSIAENGVLLHSLQNEIQKDHAAFLHPAIEKLCSDLTIKLSDLSAIAVTEGPGSYTGLRVGMASAKGLCYALDKPLICIGSLPLLAHAAIKTIETAKAENARFTAMIDARRMEVYTAVYDEKLNCVQAPHAKIIDEQSYQEILQQPVYFFGSGAAKFQTISVSENAHFIEVNDCVHSLSHLSHEKFIQQQFSDLANTEPLYVKEFYSLG